jgi:hypothetical protein
MKTLHDYRKCWVLNASSWKGHPGPGKIIFGLENRSSQMFNTEICSPVEPITYFMPPPLSGKYSQKRISLQNPELMSKKPPVCWRSREDILDSVRGFLQFVATLWSLQSKHPKKGTVAGDLFVTFCLHKKLVWKLITCTSESKKEHNQDLKSSVPDPDPDPVDL